MKELQYITVDNPAAPNFIWWITIYTGTPGGLPDPRQGVTVLYGDILNINNIVASGIIISGNAVDVTTLPMAQQNILKLYSYDGLATNLYLVP